MAYDGVDYTGSRPIFPVEYHPSAPFGASCLSTALTTAYLCARRSSRLLIATHYPRNFQAPATERDLPNSVRSTSFVPVCDGYRYIPDGFTHVVASLTVGVQAIQACTLSVRVRVTREIQSTAWQRASNILTITLPSGHGFVAGEDAITFDTATAGADQLTPIGIGDNPSSTTIRISQTGADAGPTTEAGIVAVTDLGDAASFAIEPGPVDAPPPGASTEVALALAQLALVSAFRSPMDDQRARCWVALDLCPSGRVLRIQIEAKVVDQAGSAVSWRPIHGVAWGEVRDG